MQLSTGTTEAFVTVCDVAVCWVDAARSWLDAGAVVAVGPTAGDAKGFAPEMNGRGVRRDVADELAARLSVMPAVPRHHASVQQRRMRAASPMITVV